MKTVHILHWVGGITGLGVLALGLFIWISGMSLPALPLVHALLGLIFVLTLLTIGIIATQNRGTRLQGVICIIYAPLVLIFGIVQTMLLPDSSLHWLIRTAHLLVGLGALVLLGMTGMRYLRLKQHEREMSGQPQLVR